MEKNPLYEVREIANLQDMLNQSAEIFKTQPAFLVKSKGKEEYIPVTYEKFKADVDSLGTALMSLGLKGKRIAIIGENRYEWAVSYLAVVNGTGIVVPIDKELPENEIESLIKRSEASAVIFSCKFEDFFRKLSEEKKELKYIISMDELEEEDKYLRFDTLISKGKKLLDKGNSEFVDAVIDNEAMNIMLFTSGTTNRSKAVMLSHENICANLMDMCAMTCIYSNDIFLSFLPIHHTYECTCGFLCPIYRGATVAYCEGLRHIVKNLKESKATVMLSVPLILENIYKRIWDQAQKSGKAKQMKTALGLSNFLKNILGIDIRKKLFKQIHENLGGSMRLLISGAAGINPKVAKGFRDFGIPFIQGYGLTECSPIAALNRDVWFKDASAGLPMPNGEVKIKNIDSEGIGEIVVKGSNVMLGYYQNEEATNEVLKDGWFYTGDLGYIDKDGFVYVTGRKKDVIVTKNGKNIFPEELEKVLNDSLYIKESMVFGKPDKGGDIIICATIVFEKEVIQEKLKKDSISKDEVRDIINQEIKALNKNMPLYRHIREFTIREEEFTKTTTKKIKRYIELAKQDKLENL